MGSYRGAVIGCGRIGSTIDDEHVAKPQFRYPRAHAPAMIEAKGIDLVAASDLSTDQLDDFKRRWDVTALYTDYREMIAKEQPDIVSVTTRAEERADVVMGVARNGRQSDLCDQANVSQPRGSGRDDRHVQEARSHTRNRVSQKLESVVPCLPRLGSQWNDRRFLIDGL